MLLFYPILLAFILTPFTNEILYWAILPMGITVVIIVTAGLIAWKLLKHKVVNRKRRVKVE